MKKYLSRMNSLADWLTISDRSAKCSVRHGKPVFFHPESGKRKEPLAELRLYPWLQKYSKACLAEQSPVIC
jgi:hypothetical protein